MKTIYEVELMAIDKAEMVELTMDESLNVSKDLKYAYGTESPFAKAFNIVYRKITEGANTPRYVIVKVVP